MKNFTDFLIYNLFESKDEKYAIELDKTKFYELLDKHCKVFEEIHVPFYRGDPSLNGDYYLINSKRIK